MSPVRILIAASATGGHLYPAISLAQALKTNHPECDILFVINDKPLGSSILKDSNIPFQLISADSISLENPIRFARGLARLIVSFFESFSIIRYFKPSKVIGFGGYAAFPVILASWIFKKPIIIHEQNVIAGLSNRACAIFAKGVAISFEKTKAYFKSPKVILTGMPLRKEFYGANGKPLDVSNKLRILALGGSQGAHRINVALTEALRIMNQNELKGFEVFHITGRGDLEYVKDVYRDLGGCFKAEPYISDIISLYKWCDLIISRAGASTIFELMQLSKPSILTPYPYGGAHQIENAKVLSDIGAAILIPDGEFTPQRLKRELLDLENNRHIISEMSSKLNTLPKPNGCENLTNLICG